MLQSALIFVKHLARNVQSEDFVRQKAIKKTNFQNIYGKAHMCVHPMCMQETAAQLARWLEHVRVETTYRYLAFEDHPYFTVVYQSTAMLRTQLSVLRAVRFASPKAKEGAYLQLRGVPLTHDTMEALRELPEWSGTISLKHCSTPLATEEYSKLAELIPTSYNTWVLPCTAGSPMHDSICAGVRARREGLGMPSLVVAFEDRELH